MSKDSVRDALGKFGREEFADWLWRGLIRFYSLPPDDKKTAFAPATSLVMEHESVLEGLAQIYSEYVPEDKGLFFRQAIGDVLRNHAKEQDAPVQAFRDLIYLIARVKATESADALLPIVGNGSLGKREPGLLYSSLAVLKSLAPSNDARKTVIGLIGSLNFDYGYLFEAIKVAVECDPTCASAIVLMHEPRLSGLYRTALSLGGNEMEAFCEVANEWAGNMLKYGTIGWINDLWERANHSSEQSWLFKILFSNKSYPVRLIYDDESDSYFIKQRSERVPLAVSDKDRWTRELILFISSWEEFDAWASSPKDVVNSFCQRKAISSGQTTKGKHTLGVAIKQSVNWLTPTAYLGDTLGRKSTAQSTV